jgi:hypothetical protein
MFIYLFKIFFNTNLQVNKNISVNICSCLTNVYIFVKKNEYIGGNTDKIIGAKSDRGFTKYRKFSKRKVQEPFRCNFLNTSWNC